MKKQDVDWVSFDLFGTLVHYTPALWFIYMLRAGLFLKKDRDIFWKGVLSSTTTNLELANIIFRENNFSIEVSELFERYLMDEINSLRLFPDSAEVLTFLRSKGYKIAVTSNLALDFGQPTLELLPIKPDAIIFSYQVGHRKPEPALFQELLHQTGASPDRILHVGDKVRNDYYAALEMGMRSILLDRKKEQVDFSTHSIASLKTLEYML